MANLAKWRTDLERMLLLGIQDVHTQERSLEA